MNISGKTKVFAVIGHPVAHSLSPVMHNANFAANRDNAVYVAFDIAPDRVVDAVHSLSALGCGGLSVTIPHKEVLYRGVKLLHESAKLAGALNTIEFTPGGPRGHNTDGEGLSRALVESFGAGFSGKKVFILGCGGAGRAAALKAARSGAKRIVLANRDRTRAETLAAGIPGASVADDWAAASLACDIILQSTSVGMKPGEVSLLPPEAFHSGQFAMDLIYTSPETPFVKAAKKGGAKAVNGLGMLLHQGAKQYEIWTGKEANLAAMRAALEKAVYNK